MRNNNKSVWVKSGAAAVAIAGLGLSSLAMAGSPIEITVLMDGGRPTGVSETSNTCPPEQGGPDVACANPGATPVHWRSDNGETITIVFKGAVPDGLNLSNGGISGNVNGVISANATAGSYSYGITGPAGTLDPVIIVTR
ncbi:MAG: hypothetical protein MUP90_18770 [Gammaproteobacteria bacterium]|nr:hypothetical protein [Gammaproteobacteria bacterium]